MSVVDLAAPEQADCLMPSSVQIGLSGSVYRLKWTYSAPSHNSKTVLSIVKIGPPLLAKSRNLRVEA